MNYWLGLEQHHLAGWVAMAEDWNVVQDRLEVIAGASYPACTAQSNYLILSLRHRPRKGIGESA